MSSRTMRVSDEVLDRLHLIHSQIWGEAADDVPLYKTIAKLLDEVA